MEKRRLVLSLMAVTMALGGAIASKAQTKNLAFTARWNDAGICKSENVDDDCSTSVSADRCETLVSAQPAIATDCATALYHSGSRN